MKVPVVLALLIGIFVLACSTVTPAPAEPTPDIDATVEATGAQELVATQAIDTPTPTPTSTPTPRVTTVPTPTPTPTPEPTSTPTPTATPTPKPTPLPAIPVNAAKNPPFDGTLYFGHDFVTAEDVSYFVGLEERPSETRTMYDRRFGWVNLTPYLFHATFSDGLSIEVQINPEFDDAELRLELATKYLRAIGQLPTVLRTDVQTVWIHEGDEAFGGGNDNLLIHRGRASTYENDGILEEALIHEAAHTSLDAYHKYTRDWLSAQTNDGRFISNYARDNPDREDVSESFSMWYALRYKTSRIPENTRNIILSTIPNRIQYFDTHIPIIQD